MIEAMYLSMPLSTSTCLKAPPPPMISALSPAIILIEEVSVSLICSMERPRFRPKVNRAMENRNQGRHYRVAEELRQPAGRAWPFGRIISATARIAIQDHRYQ